MKSKFYTVIFLAVSNAFLLSSIEKSFATSDSGQFIYGKVTTVNDEVYEGHIRWGKEEVFWFDFFNSSKPENNHLKWLSKKEVSNLNDKDYEASTGYFEKLFYKKWHYSSDHTHSFACRFGDIQSIDVKPHEKIRVTFKNGEHFDLSGGSNDVGAQLQVSDDELGVIKIDWNRIQRVEFSQAPKSMQGKFGEPLYGVVKTSYTSFEGFLQWDHDERLSTDELNGDSQDGQMDIEFGKIKSIKKSNKGSLVTLRSGRTFNLTGSNDVNDENRGIIVNIPNMGRVDIPWDEFEEITFNEVIPSVGRSYKDFQGSQALKASISTNEGENLRGKIIYDLDEEYKLEMLDGVKDNIEYFIPFEAIKSVTPKNRKESLVELHSGDKYLLEGKVDVNESNDGILLMHNDNNQYIPWSKIEKITFE